MKRLVELHGGQIEARSVGQGRGSEFLVRLPVARRGAPDVTSEPLTASTPEPHAVRRRVLIVDDSRDSVETLALLLRVSGHDVRVALDGPGALEVAASFVPEVVLLDIGLPGMSGYEVAAQLRQVPGFASALIVALTGYGQLRDRDRSRNAGFDHHLTKPVDHKALLDLIQSSRRGG